MFGIEKMFSGKAAVGGSPENKKTEEWSEGAVRAEERAFAGFGEGAKKFTAVLALITTLTLGGMKINEACAQETPQPADKTSVEKEKSVRERAVDLLKQLYNLPDNPRAVNSVQNKLMKAEAARSRIILFALQLREGFKAGKVSGQVMPADIAKAVNELIGATETFADQELGNKDSKIDGDEKSKFRKAIAENPGISTLMEMYGQYKPTLPQESK